MKAPLNLPPSHEPWSAADARLLLLTARSLKHAAGAGNGRPLLKGKKVALLCDQAHCGCGTAFDDAASALGAHVSRLHADAVMSPDAARLLGHLYDAIDCEHIAADATEALKRNVNVPVYVGLGRADHPVMRLLEPGSSDEDRRYLRQALLLSTIG